MKKNLVIFIMLVFIFWGCGGKEEIKPSADSLLTMEALHNINTIVTAFMKKDRDTLQKYLSPALAERVVQGLSFGMTDLSTTTRMVEITASTVRVNTNWHGAWVINGNKIKDRGVAVFVFEGSPMKLIRVDGDNPFHTPLAKD